jgi:hypothetical protein
MQRGDGPSLDACYEDAVGVVLVLLDEVARSLLGGNSNQWHALICWLEPDNLGLVLSLWLGAARVALASLTLSLLLLLGGLAARAQESKGSVATISKALQVMMM